MIACNYTVKLDRTLPIACKVQDGETIDVETVSAYGADFHNINELMDLMAGKHGDRHHHPLTGPIMVDGAKAGDVLKVTIHNIKIEIMGQALSQSAGIAPIQAENFGDRAPTIAFHEAEGIHYLGGITIPYKPMLGIIGTAPEEGYIKTGHAGNTGGNLDIPFICEGVDIYIPVKADGGMLFLGDAHGSQGYGELGGIALEASAKVRATVSILHPREPFPCIVAVGKEPMTGKDAIGIIGVAESFQDLNEAVLDAYGNAVKILSLMLPSINENMIRNFISALGHSMNGQAFSKTSESTSLIAFLEEDLQRIMKSGTFSVYDFEKIWFHAGMRMQ